MPRRRHPYGQVFITGNEKLKPEQPRKPQPPGRPFSATDGSFAPLVLHQPLCTPDACPPDAAHLYPDLRADIDIPLIRNPHTSWIGWTSDPVGLRPYDIIADEFGNPRSMYGYAQDFPPGQVVIPGNCFAADSCPYYMFYVVIRPTPPAPAVTITEVHTATGGFWALRAHQPGQFTTGNTSAFYLLSVVPDYLGHPMIATAHADRNSTLPAYLTFTIDVAARVVVYYRFNDDQGPHPFEAPDWHTADDDLLVWTAGPDYRHNHNLSNELYVGWRNHEEVGSYNLSCNPDPWYGGPRPTSCFWGVELRWTQIAPPYVGMGYYAKDYECAVPWGLFHLTNTAGEPYDWPDWMNVIPDGDPPIDGPCCPPDAPPTPDGPYMHALWQPLPSEGIWYGCNYQLTTPRIAEPTQHSGTPGYHALPGSITCNTVGANKCRWTLYLPIRDPLGTQGNFSYTRMAHGIESSPLGLYVCDNQDHPWHPSPVLMVTGGEINWTLHTHDDTYDLIFSIITIVGLEIAGYALARYFEQLSARILFKSGYDPAALKAAARAAAPNTSKAVRLARACKRAKTIASPAAQDVQHTLLNWVKLFEQGIKPSWLPTDLPGL